MKPRVLELGNYVVPAYAGMLLAEQGYAVTKWVNGRDPILSLAAGADLWGWLNAGKTLDDRHPADLLGPGAPGVAVVLDNFRPETLAGWGIDPAALAAERSLVWVSMRSELPGRSFDLIAQARSWLEYTREQVPFWVGDTSGGLWLAFKALAMHAAGRPGHYTLGQASCMQKLVEGELFDWADLPRRPGAIPWETDRYGVEGGEAVVEYKGDVQREPVRRRDWKREHLRHVGGRITV